MMNAWATSIQASPPVKRQRTLGVLLPLRGNPLLASVDLNLDAQKNGLRRSSLRMISMKITWKPSGQIIEP